MLRSTLRLVAAALLAVGLVFAPSAAGAKSKKSDKKASSRDAKKGSKHDKKDKTAKKDKDKKGKSKKDSRSDDRTAKRSKHDSDSTAKVSKRGKNDGDDDDDDDDRSSRARRTAPPPSQTVAKRTVDDDSADADDDGDEADEPPGPKPANRIVADMSPVRVTQIQTALISKGFLVGPPNGVYDQPTFQAMAAFQARNGWNAVGVPTADSLKALGVPKTSGRTYMTPSRVVEATAPAPQ